jgi:signal transduction histidine kinase
VWVGGSDGVALFANGRFRAVTGEGGAPIRGVSGMVETRAGELWMNGADGITRISKGELDLLLGDPEHAPTVQRFDTEDGLDGVPRQVRPLPTMIEASDGKLWFSTSAGLYWIDPAHIERNRLPPPVLIRAVRAGDKSFDVTEDMHLPQRTTSLAITYAALSLAIPERVHFRYRLDGVDDTWQDAGTRRQAFYTQLGPGHYRFHVIAANDDGVWNETGATLDFSIQPAFFETTWFRAACLVLMLALLYALYRWRLRVAKARMQDKLQERLAERERIARELHDTLLQSVNGLVLRFETATQKLAKSEPVRPMFEAALEHADEVLIEGRDRVLDLRMSGTAVGLTNALTNAGRDLSQHHAAQFDAVTLGLPRELHPVVSDEVLQIAREALLNAFRHAGATGVEVTLDYAEPELRLSVRDDGCGIDAQVLAAGGRPGHWGLASMRERAHKIGAQLEIHSEHARGTRIELAVPAELAYRDFVSMFSQLWPWRSRESRRSPA